MARTACNVDGGWKGGGWGRVEILAVEAEEDGEEVVPEDDEVEVGYVCSGIDADVPAGC